MGESAIEKALRVFLYSLGTNQLNLTSIVSFYSSFTSSKMASLSVLNCPFYLLHLLQLRLGGKVHVAEQHLGIFLLLPSSLLEVESEDVPACESVELLAAWLVGI